GAIDLGSVNWLLEHGADRDMVKDAVTAEIRSGRRPHTALAADLDLIRNKLHKVWVVREAIAVRVQAAGRDPDARVLLSEALKWNQVPQGQRATSYDAALNTILAFGDLDDIVGEMRA
ncbi:MAG TPA: hypothetical protein VGK17_15710, partial [Propionicimonas sp.]